MLQLLMKGGRPLKGEVHIGGAKNAALGILAAAIMTDEPVTLENLPDVSDINVMLDAIADIGAKVERLERHTVRITAASIHTQHVLCAAAGKIRASYYLIGALLGKYKYAEVILPGGCAIGLRPIDQHLKGFHALGATTEMTDYGSLIAQAENLKGRRIQMDCVSVGATINVMLAAVMAEGITKIKNAAQEPHVVDVASLLNCMGARIFGAGTDEIRIEGVEKLHGITYAIVPDQIEAGTFMMAAAATNGDIKINNVIPLHLSFMSDKLMEIGCTVEEGIDYVRVIGNPDNQCGLVIETAPYPGYPTDMQPQTAVVLTLCNGKESKVIEKIFENRFAYVEELDKMGADIDVNSKGDEIAIHGVDKLHGADLWAHDLRAGAALTIAGLAADGYTVISDVKFILRGYEDFDYKLQALGGQIKTIHSLAEADEFFKSCGDPNLAVELEQVPFEEEDKATQKTVTIYKEFAHVVEKAVQKNAEECTEAAAESAGAAAEGIEPAAEECAEACQDGCAEAEEADASAEGAEAVAAE